MLNWARYSQGQNLVNLQYSGRMPNIPIDLTITNGDNLDEKWLFVLSKEHDFMRVLTLGNANTCLAEFAADQMIESVHIDHAFRVGTVKTVK